MIHDDDWTFTNMDTKIGSPRFYTGGLKSIHWSYNIDTYFVIITGNAILYIFQLLCN